MDIIVVLLTFLIGIFTKAKGTKKKKKPNKTNKTKKKALSATGREPSSRSSPSPCSYKALLGDIVGKQQWTAAHNS